MNCPSRNDSPLSHPEWNQSPTPLNADLTTNNDLNGLVNARAHRGGGSGGGAGSDDGSEGRGAGAGGAGDPMLAGGRSGIGGLPGEGQEEAEGVGVGEGRGAGGEDEGEDEGEGDAIRVTGREQPQTDEKNNDMTIESVAVSAPEPAVQAQHLHHRLTNPHPFAHSRPDPGPDPDSPAPVPVPANETHTNTDIDEKYHIHVNNDKHGAGHIDETNPKGPVPAYDVPPDDDDNDNDANTTHPKSRSCPLTLPHCSLPTIHLLPAPAHQPAKALYNALRVLIQFCRFIGPGFIVAVAYIDPGNYATAVSAGADTQYRLLFMTLLSNIIAIFLQSLCVKLGTVTGLNLAEMCRLHLPRWMVYILYVLAEICIIATDVSEVVGAVIAWNLLCNVPLVAGCFITLAEVFATLFLYRPNGSLGMLRVFEYFVMALVLGVVICFCIQLSLITNSTPGEVFRGYLPSKYIVQGNGVYLSCGILGATVMPHSLFLGSGIVQSRLKSFDIKHGHIDAKTEFGRLDGDVVAYRPSLRAIRSCLKYSVGELAICLFTFALFVNSAILVVAGASLFGNDDAGDADLFGIYELMHTQISLGAATIFAIALLLSGVSAGIVCTVAGQFISEGMLNWKMRPWLRRVMTRCISVVPAVVISAAVGKQGMNTTLTACQVVLSAILPFVSAPLLYFTGRNKYMMVRSNEEGTRTFPLDEQGQGASGGRRGSTTTESGSTSTGDRGSVSEATIAAGEGTRYVGMRNHPVVSGVASLLWLLIVVMNVANIVLVGLGKAS